MQLNLKALFSFVPAIAIVPVNISAPVALRADGYVITMHITAAQPIDLTFKAAGDKMRVEPDLTAFGGRGGRGMGDLAKGMYILPTPDGKTVWVLPNMNMGGANGMAISMAAGAMMGQAAPTAEIGEATVEDLGAGEAILGHATHKYRVKSGSNDAQLWFATDIPGLDYKKFASAFGARFTGTDPRNAAKMPNGFLLKMVSSGPDAVTIEVTKIEKASFTDADFQVPAGMQVMDGSMFGGRGRGNQ